MNQENSVADPGFPRRGHQTPFLQGLGALVYYSANILLKTV